ncbi:uncharacterized mitochondrial protein-like protein [Tanacetum coccineum]
MIVYSLWEVVENGNSAPKTKLVEGVETIIPPTTAEEKAQRRLLRRVIKQKKVPTNFSTHAYSFLTILNSEVYTDSNCLSSCLENVKILKEQNEKLLKDLRTSKLNAIAYKTGLESVEARILVYKKNKYVYEEDIKVLKCEIHLRELAIIELRRKLELAQKQKDEIQLTVENFENSSKNLSKLIDCQIVDKCKTGLGYNVVPPPYIGNFMPPKPNLSFSGLEEFMNKPIVSESTVKKLVVEISEDKGSADKPKIVRKNNGALIIEEWVSDSEDEVVSKPKIEKKTRVNIVKGKNVNTVGPKAVVNTAKPKAVLNAVKGNHDNQDLDEKGVIDSGCSRHMTGNMSYLINSEEIDGGYVAFGGNPKGGKITGSGTIKTGGLTCPLAKDTSDESNLGLEAWTHKFKTTKKLVKEICKARTETVPGKDYILLPLWTANLPFSQSSKISPDVGFKPLGDNENPRKYNEFNDQEKEDSDNSTNNVNGASSNEVNAIGSKTSIDLPGDPNMPELEDIVYSDDDEDVGAETDINNLDAFMSVSPIPTTRINKDHLVEQIIRDLNSAPQTRRMTKNLKEHEEPKKIEEEVYVCQPPGFEDPDFPDRVYKVEKALYGLHQAPRAWYETLSTYLLDNGFQRGKIDKTLFIKRDKGDIMLVQVYLDDIIFGSTKKSLCTEFKKMTRKKFQTKSIGELTFFLGLQVKQKEDRIFISQDKYVTEILKKFGFTNVKTARTPMETQNPLLKDEDGEEMDVHLYRSMIGSLMYLTSSRPDIMFAVCAYARYQVNPKVSHLYDVKRIFSDYAVVSLDRKSQQQMLSIPRE